MSWNLFVVPTGDRLAMPAAVTGILLGCFATAASAQVHVPNDFPTIQQAVNAAESEETILVGPGVYPGSINLLGKSLTLLATHGPEKTTLDGEDQNISVVVIIGDPNEDPPQVVIEGFTITRGRGTLINDLRRGGGLRAQHAEVTVRQCVFTLNVNAQRGAGMYLEASKADVLNCHFSENHAPGGSHGGGIYAIGSELEVVNSEFRENRAGRGAGIAVVASEGLIDQCDFVDNNPTGGQFADGGGLYSDSSTFTISHCQFRENQASGGGAIRNESASHHVIINCLFQDNTATWSGGGIANVSSSPTIQNCQFIGNHAVHLATSPTEGGGVSNINSSPTIIDSHFEDNAAFVGGGVMNGGGSPTIVGCTFVNNSAVAGGGAGNWYGSMTVDDSTFLANHADYGGAIYLFFAGPEPTISNCTFTGNTAAERGGTIDAVGVPWLWITGCAISDSHSLVGGGIVVQDGTVIIVDTSLTDLSARTGGGLFVDAEQGGAAQLQNATFCRMQDAAIVGPWTDFGGVSNCPTTTVHVPGQYSTIQQAINAAQTGTEIVVAPGTYNEAIDLLGKAITVRSSAGPETTVINAAGIAASVVTCASGEPPGTRISGFTITGGTGGTPAGPNRHGGGFYLFESAAPTIENCIITGNHIEVGTGGALATWDGRPFIKDCLISDNSDSWGSTIYNIGRLDLADTIFEDNDTGGNFGVVFVYGGPLTVERCTIRNHAGRAIDANQSDVFIADSVFENNQSTAVRLSGCFSTIERSSFIGNSTLSLFNQHGGALYFAGGITSVADCLFKHNVSGSNGGAVAFGPTTASSPTFTRCHFIENYASQRGGGAWVGNTARFIECVFQGNRVDADGGAIFVNAGSDARVSTTTFCDNQPNHLVGSWLDLGGNQFFEDCPILGDLNGDGVVDVSDLLLLLAAWGPCPRSGDCQADLNGDGTMDVSDLLILLANWG